MFLKIIKAEYLGKFELNLTFNNGETARINLESELWGEVFAPLKSEEKFKEFQLINGTLEWPNGADFAPEFLYELSSRTHQDSVSK